VTVRARHLLLDLGAVVGLLGVVLVASALSATISIFLAP